MAHRCTDTASRHLYREALKIAAANHNIHIVEVLFENNFDFGLKLLTETLNSICNWGGKEALLMFLRHDTKGIFGIQQYSSGLNQPARSDNSQLVSYWVDEYPDHHKLVVDPAAVIDVSGNGFLDILPLLIKQIQLMDSAQRAVNQCLQVASLNGHQETVEYLIGQGANVNAVVEEA